MCYLRQAFEAICKDAKKAEVHYVCLMENRQRYGGPEEGGWWTTDSELLEYKEFPTREVAEEAARKVVQLADELSRVAKGEFDQQMARSVDWLEARGLDADFLPEPDGPTTYSVRVTTGSPAQPSYGPTHYE